MSFSWNTRYFFSERGGPATLFTTVCFNDSKLALLMLIRRMFSTYGIFLGSDTELLLRLLRSVFFWGAAVGILGRSVERFFFLMTSFLGYYCSSSDFHLSLLRLGEGLINLLFPALPSLFYSLSVRLSLSSAPTSTNLLFM